MFFQGIENDKDSTVDHSAQDCSNNCAEVTTDEAAQDTREYQVVECQEVNYDFWLSTKCFSLEKILQAGTNLNKNHSKMVLPSIA